MLSITIQVWLIKKRLEESKVGQQCVNRWRNLLEAKIVNWLAKGGWQEHKVFHSKVFDWKRNNKIWEVEKN